MKEDTQIIVGEKQEPQEVCRPINHAWMFTDILPHYIGMGLTKKNIAPPEAVQKELKQPNC